MQSLQESANQSADAHYQSNYRGPTGVVAFARGQWWMAKANLDAFPYAHNTYQYITLRNYALTHLMSFISTLCSAINPAAKKGHIREARKLQLELQSCLVALNEMGYEDLNPTEREVAIAALSNAWFNQPDWARRIAITLGERVLTDVNRSLSNELLTMARLLAYEEIPESQRLIWRNRVTKVVFNVYALGAVHNGLKWSTIARLASHLGMKKEMHFAAKMDGTPDVLIKYGTFLSSMKARWQTRRT